MKPSPGPHHVGRTQRRVIIPDENGEYPKFTPVRIAVMGVFEERPDQDQLGLPPKLTGKTRARVLAVMCGMSAEDEANAHLFANASALLHALRSLMAGLDSKEPEQFPGHHVAYLETVAKPRAAEILAKLKELGL